MCFDQHYPDRADDRLDKYLFRRDDDDRCLYDLFDLPDADPSLVIAAQRFARRNALYEHRGICHRVHLLPRLLHAR